MIVGFSLAPADAHQLSVAEGLLEGAKGWALGDRNYWSPNLTGRLGEQGLGLLAPYKSKKGEKKPWPRSLVHERRRIETVFSQLRKRYRTKGVRARDWWHLGRAAGSAQTVEPHRWRLLLPANRLSSPLRFSDLLTHQNLHIGLTNKQIRPLPVTDHLTALRLALLAGKEKTLPYSVRDATVPFGSLQPEGQYDIFVKQTIANCFVTPRRG